MTSGQALARAKQHIKSGEAHKVLYRQAPRTTDWVYGSREWAARNIDQGPFYTPQEIVAILGHPLAPH